MRIVVLGGAGAMGQAAVKDLVESSPVKEIVIADLQEQPALELKARLHSNKLVTSYANVTDNPTKLAQTLKGSHIVINCTPYYFNVNVMQAALLAGCHYLDLGGLFHTTRKQLELNNKFKEKQLLAIVGMGAAPGLTNIMAAHAAEDFDQIESIDIVLGGIDFTKHDHPFLPPYALDTIFDEYTMEPVIFEDGRFQSKPPLSGELLVDFPNPIGTGAAFLTLHSEIATLPLTYQHKGIRNVTYRLALPTAFHERMKFLISLGFSTKDDLTIGNVAISPRKVLTELIMKHPVPNVEPDDGEAIRVDVFGIRNNRKTRIRMETVVLSHKGWHLSSGALDTGVPPSIVAQMIGLGLIQNRGVLPPEACVPSGLFFLELAKRSIVMHKITNEALAETQILNSNLSRTTPQDMNGVLSKSSR